MPTNSSVMSVNKLNENAKTSIHTLIKNADESKKKQNEHTLLAAVAVLPAF